jgi:hypothetical protein
LRKVAWGSTGMVLTGIPLVAAPPLAFDVRGAISSPPLHPTSTLPQQAASTIGTSQRRDGARARGREERGGGWVIVIFREARASSGGRIIWPRMARLFQAVSAFNRVRAEAPSHRLARGWRMENLTLAQAF